MWGTTPLGTFSGIHTLHLSGTSTLNYYGGETSVFDILGNSSATIQGGRIDFIYSYQNIGNPHIEMVVKDYAYNAGTNLLTGIWGDDTAFSIELVDQDGYDPVFSNIAFTVVPEPVSLLLFGAGVIGVCRRRNIYKFEREV